MNVNTIQLEKHFEALLQEAARNDGCHVIPLPDDCKIGLAAGNPNCEALEKPYDFGLVYKGHYMAVECKLVKGKTLQGSKIAQHQHDGLKDAMAAGAYGVLAIYFMFKVGMRATRASFFVDYSRYAHLDKPPSFSYDELSNTNKMAVKMLKVYDTGNYADRTISNYFDYKGYLKHYE